MENVNLFSKEYIKHAMKMRERYFQTGSLGKVTGIRNDILECWEQSYLFNKTHKGMGPDDQKKVRLSEQDFKKALEDSRDLISAAEPYMHLLHSFLDPDHFWVTLMDGNGIILKLVGNEKMLHEANSTSVYEGSYRGDEAPYPGLFYTCWKKNKPFQIVATEHPASIDDNIAGAGCPINEIGTNRCLGVIGISGHWWKSHDHTLGLTIMTAEAISRQLALLKKNADIIEANQNLKIALESADFGMIYFHRDGSIRAVNDAAIEMLSFKPENEDDFRKNFRIFDFFQNIASQKDLDGMDREIDAGGSFSCDLVPTRKYEPLHCTIRHVSGQRPDYFMQLQKCSDLNKMATDRAISQTSFSFSDIVGRSSIMMDTIDSAQIAAKHNTSVLITGESGTGKEMFAQAIHNDSPRADAPFVAINCGAIPRSLIESELFGYEAGAFTGAQKNGHPGKFELANNGTIFLDEIGDMPYEIQVTLLRVLQSKEVVRIGGKVPIKIDVRVIAATNQNLEERIRDNTFRQDLFYRLNVLNIRLPALRERAEDIELLSNFFIQKYGRTFDKRVVGVSEEALAAMRRYSWPGNVRELENTIERAVIVCGGNLLQITDLPEVIRGTWKSVSGPQPTISIAPVVEDGSAYKTLYNDAAVQEREMLRNCLRICGGNLSDVAKQMGVSRPTVYRKLKKHGLYVKNKYDI